MTSGGMTSGGMTSGGPTSGGMTSGGTTSGGTTSGGPTSGGTYEPWIEDVSVGPAPPLAAGAVPRSTVLASCAAIGAGLLAALACLAPLVTVRGTLRSGGPPQSELGLGRTETVRAVNLTDASFGLLQTSWPLAAVVLGLGALSALGVAVLIRTRPSAAVVLGLVPTVAATVGVLIAALDYRHERLLRPRAVRLGTVFVDDASPGPAVWLCVASAALALAGAVIWLTTIRGGHRAAGRRLAGFVRIRIVHRPT